MIVIGVPDAYRGETVKAFVVLRGDATLTLEDLQKHLKDRLSPIEMPRQLKFVSSSQRPSSANCRALNCGARFAMAPEPPAGAS